MPDLLLSTHYVTIHYKDTLLVTDREGWIGEGRTGLFNHDTRYFSTYRLAINGFDPLPLGLSRPQYFTAVHYYTNPKIGTEPHEISENSLLLKVSRYIHDGVHEDIDLTNYSGKPVQLILSLSFGTDFSDIFQVRGLERLIPRIAQSHWDADSQTLHVQYRKGDFTRTMVYRFHDCTTPPLYGLETFTFRIRLAHGETWHSCGEVHFGHKPAPEHDQTHTLPALETELRQWRALSARVETPGASVEHVHSQAVADIGSLRLEESGGHWFPAAGIPWYTALFGRDALITALQTLTLYCPFGMGVLERLAQLQGTKVDAWTEEEPGRLPHEMRHGELANTGKIPHRPYYGTVDAPLLYVILLHELYRFTADRQLLDRFSAAGRACLDWAARYGDFDGDGFIEYRPFSPKGYRNQGWKDASDAVMYPNGSLVEPPIAICEVQGYHYDALLKMADIARLCGHEQDATAFTSRAKDLFERFNEVFWLEDQGFYAFGLDPSKQPIETIASNAGHLLWSGIVPPDRAGRVVQHLMGEDMFSGWGIRTVSARNPAFDPVSYQRGSIWPHDNAIIALGFKRYGFWQEANRIAEGIFDVAYCYEQHSLPELFAGINRSAGDKPVPYIEANMPQAWAAGSVFMLLQAILGLEPDPAHRRLVITPTLPDWLPELTLRNLDIFGSRVDLRFRGYGPRSTVDTLHNEGAVEIELSNHDMGQGTARPDSSG